MHRATLQTERTLVSEAQNALGPIRVGSWPGPNYAGNEFIQIFCRSLTEAGVEVVSVDDPTVIDLRAIDVLHIHWAEQIFWKKLGPVRLIFYVISLLMRFRELKRAGISLVWMVHNLTPHDAGRWHRVVWKLYTQRLAKLVDAYVSLSPATLPAIAAAFQFSGAAKAFWIRHPSYARRDDGLSTNEARKKWGVGEGGVSLGFVGAVRAYKGVAELAREISLCDGGAVSLLIAGECKSAQLRAQVDEIVEHSSAVRFIPHRTDDREFEEIIVAVDYVVLPFSNSLHSGSIVHALSLGSAVITTPTPYAQDLAKIIGDNWVVIMDRPVMAVTLSELGKPPAGVPNLAALNPTLVGRRMVECYRELIDAKRQSA